MKQLLLSLFVISSLSCFAQMNKYVGRYDGYVTKDTLSLRIIFDLNADSTYLITMEVDFKTWCDPGNDTITYKGKWIAKKGWLYFAPYSTMWSEGEFYFGGLKKNKYKRRMEMHNEGYDYFLKPRKGINGCTRIFFSIGNDCYGEIWHRLPIRKTNCR